MFRSRLFGFAAVTLCLLAFVSAHGEGSKRTAKEKVKEAQNLTDKVLIKVQGKYRDASNIKEKVESGKTRAESAANDAKTAAKDNAEAADFVEHANTAVTEYLNLYPSAKVEAEKAFGFANDLLAQARPLEHNAEKTIVPDTATEEEYAELLKNAAAFTKEAKEIEQKINEARALIGTAEGKLWPLERHVEKAVVAKYQVDAIIKVVEIENMLSKADEDIKSIKLKKEEVNVTVEEIRAIFKNLSHELTLSNSGSLYIAEGHLSDISSKIKEAEEAKKEMVKYKSFADEFLNDIKKDTEEEKADKNFRSVEYHANNAAAQLEKITKALESADTDVQNAKNRKEGLLNALAKKRSQTNGKNEKSTEIPQPPAQDGRTQQTNKDTEQTVENNVKQSVNNEPTKPVIQGTEETVENEPEQSVNNKAVKPVTQGIEQTVENEPKKFLSSEPTNPTKGNTETTVENNPKQSVKNKIKEIVNNEGLSTSNVINDNAIAVMFSLPLALIVFFALHGGY